MTEQMMRCMRCKGRKSLYKVGPCYSFVDTGGTKIKCPMCLGKGSIKTLEKVIEDINENKEIITDISAYKEVIADNKEISTVKQKRKYVRKNSIQGVAADDNKQ